MIPLFHFLRPFWLFAFIPLVVLLYRLFKIKTTQHPWQAICDSHLQPYVIKMNGQRNRAVPISLLLISSVFFIISLSGPTWSRFPVPTFQTIQPRVIVLDLSDNMLADDVSPNRLTRAKFKLHDLFQHHDAGQFALVAYTDEPFVISPLTDDGETIDALLPSLLPSIMPVSGNRLERGLEKAGQLITQAGFQTGQILVLTAETPSERSLQLARTLASRGLFTSVIPISHQSSMLPLFKPLALAGKGHVIALTDTTADLEHWLALSKGDSRYAANQQDIPVWHDKGRWFIIPALLFLLPVFRRGWLQRLDA